MKTVLFVCVHNAGRSQMAEAFLNRLAAERGLPVRGLSAGTVPGTEINPVARAVMAEVGIALDGHMPKVLTQEMADSADRVITMGCGVDADVCPARIHLSEDWGLDDPKGRPIEEVRAIRNQIREQVNALLNELIPGMTVGVREVPVACNLNTFDAAQSERHRALLSGLRAAIQECQELPDGYAFALPSDAETCARAMEFITLERLCCPFLTFRLELAPGGSPLTLSLTGPEGIKEIFAGFAAS